MHCVCSISEVLYPNLLSSYIDVTYSRLSCLYGCIDLSCYSEPLSAGFGVERLSIASSVSTMVFDIFSIVAVSSQQCAFSCSGITDILLYMQCLCSVKSCNSRDIRTSEGNPKHV